MRLLDLILSLALFFILIPIFIPIMLLLFLTGEGKVFYKQVRIGKNGNKFEVLKFATMLQDSPNIGAGTITVRDDPRVLPVGRILRKTKINELPQIINVIKGEMSLIGPRPHAERDLMGVDKYNLELVLKLTPGISGIGSIVFRDEEKILHSSDQPRHVYDNVIAPYKAELEIWYLKNGNISKYIILLFLTIYVVFKNESQIIFRVFPTLPKPPQQLVGHLN